MVIACIITLYFFRQNLIGIHESSGKALKIMVATTVMAVVMLVWCGATLAVHGPVNHVPLAPDLSPKVEYEVVQGSDRVTGEKREMWQRDPAHRPTRAQDGDRRPRPARPSRSSTRPPASRKIRWASSASLSPSLAEQAAASRATGEHHRRDRRC